MTIFGKIFRGVVREGASIFQNYADGVVTLREFTAVLGIDGDVGALRACLADEDANPTSKQISGVHSLRWVLFQPGLDNDDPPADRIDALHVLVLSFVYDGDVGDALDELCELPATREILSFCTGFDPEHAVEYLEERRVKSGFMFRDLGPLRGGETFDATRAEIEEAFDVQSRFERFYAKSSQSSEERPVRERFLGEFAKETFPLALTPYERLLPDEPRTIRRMSEVIRRMQARVARRSKEGRPRRGAHTKGHGLLRGTLRVESDVPSQFAKGLFAARGETFDVVARPSNGAPHTQSDRRRDERGFALSVALPLGEKGSFQSSDFLFPEREARMGRQDFILNSDPEFFAANIREAVTIFSILGCTSNWELLSRGAAFIIGNAAFKQLYLMVRGVGAKAVPHPLRPVFHSATPYLLGDDHVVKYSAEIANQGQLSRFKVGRDPDFLRRTLRNGLAEDPIELKLFVHAVERSAWPLETLVNAVEDATTDWNTLKPRKVQVATIRFEKQDPATPAGMGEAERWSFSLWNSLGAHRPVGNINRARLFIYRNSAHLRARAVTPQLHAVANDKAPPASEGSRAAE